jgi:ATP/maltotriose-dependent transcriptional regulator MalT
MELSAVTLLQGDLAAAQAYVDETRVYLEKIGSEYLLSASAVFIAALIQAQGNYADALHWYRTSLAGLRHLLAAIPNVAQPQSHRTRNEISGATLPI